MTHADPPAFTLSTGITILLCEGVCNRGLVTPRPLGRFAMQMKHTQHVEVLPIENDPRNVRVRRFVCKTCKHVRTFGRETIRPEVVEED